MKIRPKKNSGLQGIWTHDLDFFFRPYFHYCSSKVCYCEDCFHIQIFIYSSHIWFSYIHSYYSLLQRFIGSQHSDQLPVGFLHVAQVVEHCTCIAYQKFGLLIPIVLTTTTYLWHVWEKWMILPNKCLQVDIFTLAYYQNHLHLVSLPGLYPSPTVSYAPYASSYRGFVCLFICWPVCFSFIHKHSRIHPFLKTLQQNRYIYRVSINTMVLLL